MTTEREVLRTTDVPRIWDWNIESDPRYPRYPVTEEIPLERLRRVELLSEDLRDGLGSAQKIPTRPNEILKVVELTRDLGLRWMTVGIYPGIGSLPDEVVRTTLQIMRDDFPDIVPVVLARALQGDIDWVTDCKFVHPDLNAIIFRSASAPRTWAEGTTPDQVVGSLGECIYLAAKERQIPVIAFTEDTTRTPPQVIEKFVKTAVESGAHSVGIADTTGHVTPVGAKRIVMAVRDMLNQNGGGDVRIHFHGHNDRDFGVYTAIAAVEGGADVIHGVTLGAGERAGNTNLGSLAYNLNRLYREARFKVGLQPKDRWDLYQLFPIALHFAQIMGVVIPETCPLVGGNVMTTSFGIHGAVEYEAALRLKDIAEGKIVAENEDVTNALEIVAACVYTTVGPELGRPRDYRIGPLSGSKLVMMYLWRQGYDIDLRNLDDPRIKILMEVAKGRPHVLSDEDIASILSSRGFAVPNNTTEKKG